MNCSKIYVVIVALSLWFVSSCSSDDEKVYDSPLRFADIGIMISVIDADGNDLLDPQFEYSYKEEEIGITYLYDQDGVIRYFYCCENGYNNQIMRGQYETNYYLNVLAKPGFSDGKSILYIRWNNEDVDTLEYKIYSTPDTDVCTQVWYNKEMKYDKSSSSSRSFVIVK